MSGFKHGDRVRGNGYRVPRGHAWVEGVYQGAHDLDDALALVRLESGRRVPVYTSTLEPVAPEPRFKRGDRVRVTRVDEGIVGYVSSTALGVDRGDLSRLVVPLNGDGVTIEALGPEPLKPGTVGILGSDFLIYVVDENNSKATNLHDGHQFHNPGVGGRELAGDGNFKVLHEPQAND